MMAATSLAFLAGGGTAVAADGPASETASAGQVRATFSYTRFEEFKAKDLKITVVRAGLPAYDAPVKIKDCEAPYCIPSAVAPDQAIRVADLDVDGEPEVLVDVYAGGAHCCVLSQILRWNGTAYTATERNWADPGYRLEDVNADGRPDFVTADARFAYSFAAFAFSGMPVRILTWRAGTFRDITTTRPDRIRADAADFLKSYKKLRKGRTSLGVLAAWVADQYRLGRAKQARAYLEAERRAGRLKSDQGWPQGNAFIKTVERRLRSLGYAR